MNTDIVSIILVSYNSSNYIKQSLESIFNQTYSKIELLISDDCSTDETISLVEDWVLTHSYRFVSVKVLKSDENKGTACNINKAIIQSHGKWIMPMAADDVLKVYYIKSMIDFFNTKKSIKIAYSNIEYIDENGSLISKNIKSYSKFNSDLSTAQLQNKVLLRYNPVFSTSLIFEKSIIEKYGLFDEKFSLCEDLFFLIKVTSKGEKIFYNPEILLQYRIHKGSVQVKNKQILRKYDFHYWLGLREYAFPFYSKTERLLANIIWEELLYIYKLFDNKSSFKSRLLTKLLITIPFLLLRVIRMKYYMMIKPQKEKI